MFGTLRLEKAGKEHQATLWRVMSVPPPAGNLGNLIPAAEHDDGGSADADERPSGSPSSPIGQVQEPRDEAVEIASEAQIVDASPTRPVRA